MLRLLFSLLLFASSPLSNAQETLKIASRGDATAKYVVKLLSLAAEKAQISLNLIVENKSLSSEQLRKALDNNDIDLIWTATSTVLEGKYSPIRVPIYKGLIGNRILLVVKGGENNFKQVTDMQSLRNKSLGQGQAWTDTAILKANNLNVVAVSQHKQLYELLVKGKYDGFPRGVHEVLPDIEQYAEYKLAVEKNIMLRYKMPFYLFLNKNNQALAQKLEQGLLLAIDDGSFDELFIEHTNIMQLSNWLNISKRFVIDLQNPELPDKTPIDNKKLWLDFQSLVEI